jgi:hypothetical protein
MSTLHEYLCVFIIASRWNILRMKYLSEKLCRENQNVYFRITNIAIYEIMYQNVVEIDRP